MKIHAPPMVLLTAVAMLAPLHADLRTSASYSLATETVDAGGARLTSANYRVDSSAGGITGISTVASPALAAKHGYAGQLYDLIGLQLGASGATINESDTLQLTAAGQADDATTLTLNPGTVAWSIVSGPLISISSDGVATAGSVYEDTGAVAGGAAGGFNATFPLTVLNIANDDFGLYANDGLPDAWQVQYFGENSAQAAPTATPANDGIPNLIKYAFGANPFTPSATSLPIPAVAINPADSKPHLTLTANLNPGATAALASAEVSSDLLIWHSGTDYTEVISDTTDNGVRTVVFRDTTPLSTGAHRFMRLKVTGQP